MLPCKQGVMGNVKTHSTTQSGRVDKEPYVHRSGRTGNAGRKGVCVKLYTPRQRRGVDEVGEGGWGKGGVRLRLKWLGLGLVKPRARRHFAAPRNLTPSVMDIHFTSRASQRCPPVWYVKSHLKRPDDAKFVSRAGTVEHCNLVDEFLSASIHVKGRCIDVSSCERNKVTA